MHNFETVLALLVGVTFLALVARRLDVPTPALLVTGGLLVALQHKVLSGRSYATVAGKATPGNSVPKSISSCTTTPARCTRTFRSGIPG